MFDAKSRYAGLDTYTTTDARGRTVSVVPAAERPLSLLLGYHLRRQGERIDHMAARYLDDAAGSWRIAEMADAMLPEALGEAREIPIPRKVR